MGYIPLEKLIRPDKTSLYKLVLTASARANELSQGGQPLVRTTSKKVSAVALEEIADGKVHYEETKSKKKSAA